MVDDLVARQVIRTESLQTAFRAVPRHVFVPDAPLDLAYSNAAVVTCSIDGKPTSSSSQPEIMALMLEQLAVPTAGTVLEIGTGTGYNAALLAELVGPRGMVVSVDLDEAIVADARSHLATAGYDRVRTLVGDGWIGANRDAPFDRIEVTVGMWDISPYWTEQLHEGGLLVLPLMLGRTFNGSVAFRREADGRLVSVSATGAGFMPLRGPHAAPAEVAAPAGVRIGGWWTNLSDDDDRLPALRNVLADQPQVEWERPGRMFPWLGDQPDQVLLVDVELHRFAVGILDRAGPGLSVVETTSPPESAASHRLLSYGSHPPVARLVDLLPRSALASIAIEAIPAGRPTSGPANLVLPRPHYTFLFRRPAPN